MDELFSKSIDFHDDVFRNIVSIKETADYFDDINDELKELSDLANKIENLRQKDIPKDMIARDFHYSTAIAYPFETEPYMASRYGDGTYGVWYGSLELETTIFETVFHMIRLESQIENLDEPIIRERAIYKIYCESILIDLSHQHFKHPELIANDYHHTQMIGHKFHKEGHPGLLAPSARYTGTNIVVFNPNILSNPRRFCSITYTFYPDLNEVLVENIPGKRNLKISKQHFEFQKNMSEVSNEML